MVVVVLVLIIAGTSKDQLYPKVLSFKVYIASALTVGARPNASTAETSKMGSHNLSPEFIAFSLGPNRREQQFRAAATKRASPFTAGDVCRRKRSTP